MSPFLKSVLFLVFAISAMAADPQNPSGFPQPTNSEKAPLRSLSPKDAIRELKLPDGFQATVFASEPDVQQPIAFQIDSRGRLWVAEGYTYAEQALNYDLKLKDRIVIFEDADHNGVFDKRTIFWEGAQRLTGLEIGFDGVYALTLPEMIFLPDRNHDDIPDQKAEVLLDGFDHARARHTMANGLAWGPDGWLYGRQGILGTSLIGKPRTPDAQRTSINVGIWRFHPKTHHFEVVTNGTTNPWGMDWDAYGEAFHINTVIGHLWHSIPGAHFRRMFGEDPTPNIYQPIEQHADHVHWDTKELWSDIRSLGVTPTTSQAGGGHAHTGLMIYLGDNWPKEYRGDLFTINFHGRRLNRDKLVPLGSGITGKHGPDFAQFGDPWFRGIDLKYGPDGGVFVADWSDTGECHDHDGVHRVSGRIYKITYGKPNQPSVKDVKAIDQASLIKLLEHPNEWYARQARLEIQRRCETPDWNSSQALTEIKKLIETSTDPVHQVRGLFALHSAGLDQEKNLITYLKHPNHHVKIWAIRFLTDKSRTPEISATALNAIAGAANSESAPVRLALASSLQQITLQNRAAIGMPLLGHSEDSLDHNQPMMIWYGIEPLAKTDPAALTKLFQSCKIPIIRKWISRRLMQDYEADEQYLNALLNSSLNQPLEVKLDLMSGMSEAMNGRRRARKPKSWDSFVNSMKPSQTSESVEKARTMSAFFGDGLALESIRAIALDSNRDLNSRRNALKSLIEARSPGLREDCMNLFQVRDLSSTAAEGLALFDDQELVANAIAQFSKLYGYERAPVISALITRPKWAMAVLEAVESGKIQRELITAAMARQIRGHRDQPLIAKLTSVWGIIRDTNSGRLELINQWKSRMTESTLSKANLAQGQSIFKKACSSCHKMYGEGGTNGPDLTGSGRDNLDYLLHNIIDPSAQVPAGFRLSEIAMKDGRLLSGVISNRTPKSMTIQTPTETIAIDAGDVEEIRNTELSLMPDGLLENLKENEVRDLFGYLMKK